MVKTYKKTVNPIPLSLRDKKRYVLFELIYSKPFQQRDVSKSINNTFLKLFGEIGFAQQGIKLIKFNPKCNRGILKCRLSALEEIRSGILFVQEVEGKKVIPKIVLVSGTLKKASSYL